MQDYIPIKRETLTRFANEARRLGETESDLSTEQMLEIFSTIEKGGGSVAIPTIGEVELLAANWTGSNNLYSQVVSIDGVTENSQVVLNPSVEQLVVFHEKDLTFVAENEDGIVTVYAIGQKPENDYTIQVTITEVSA